MKTLGFCTATDTFKVQFKLQRKRKLLSSLNPNLIRQNECREPGYNMNKLNNHDQRVGNVYGFRVPNK